MRAIIVMTLREALRNRLAWLALAAFAGALLLGWFASAVALTESAQVRAIASGSLMRLTAVLVLCLFVVTSMVREIQDKSLELLLSFPLPRWRLLLSKLCGYWVIAGLLALLATLGAATLAPWPDALIWGASLACELMLVATFSVLCLFTFAQPTAAIASVFSFYLLARSMAAMRLMAHGPLSLDTDAGQSFIVASIDLLAFLLPELDRFSPAAWLAYHDASLQDLTTVVLQTAVYLTLLASAALVDLYRKNF
jgi:ABC-type transport system involved in multi-copper enzyme maturation permease subunit